MSEQNGQAPHPPGSNPNNGQVPVAALVAPRPVPTAWESKVVEFTVPVNPANPAEGVRKVQQVELSLHAATGVHVTYWDPESAKRLAADIRGCAADANRQQSGLILPPPGAPGDNAGLS